MMDATLPNPRFALLPSEEVETHRILLAGMNASEVNLSLWNRNTQIITGLFSFEFNPPSKYATPEQILERTGWELPDSLILSFWDHRFCLLPPGLFQEEHANVLFQTSCGPLRPDEILIQNNINKPESVLLFPIPASWKSFSEKHFSKVKFVHLMQSLLRDLSELPEHNAKHKVLIHVRSGRFDLLISENDEPVFLNSFPYQAPEDVVYFTLFSMETQGLKSEKTPVWISGQVERQSMIYRQLHKYVRHLQTLQRHKNAAFSGELDALPRHFFNALFQLPFCE